MASSMKVEVMLSSRRFFDEMLTASKPVVSERETCEQIQIAGQFRKEVENRRRRKGTHVDTKLPRIHQGFPVRNLQIEVVDERLDDDACVELKREANEKGG
jgi:hypothetical protein